MDACFVEDCNVGINVIIIEQVCMSQADIVSVECSWLSISTIVMIWFIQKSGYELL